jgi:diketogulonate reductase-like aldo/keto reductase
MMTAMRNRTFGSTGISLPVIGQGTWKLRDHEAAGRALRHGLDLGLTHIDTAELYTGSEETIGGALGDRRKEIFLVSKVLPKNASYKGTLEAAEKSLQRLRTDHIDVYLLHWWGSHSIEETMRAMAELADQGRIRFVGVSNLEIEEMEAAQSALGRRHRIVCNQVLYHLGARGIENDLLPYCQKKGIAVVGYSPFGSGRMPSPKSKGGQLLAELAAAHDATVAQVVLNHLARPEGMFLIPKAESIAHVEENARALDFELSPQEHESIMAAFPTPPAGALEMI